MEKIALLFSGQGAQYIGMGKMLYDNFSVAKETFEEASSVLGFELEKLCFEGDNNELTKTENAQPALLTNSVAAFRVYMNEIGIAPAFVAGHSLGEFSALACTGAINFSDAVKIVRMRGLFMQEASALGVGSMAAITGIDRKIIEEECAKFSKNDNIVVVSNYNSPEQTVISGHREAVYELGELLAQKGARNIPLKVSAPFHSPLMNQAAVKLGEEMQKYKYNNFRWPVISNVTALPYSEPEKITSNMTMQMTSPVQWVNSMKFLQDQGVSVVVELGAGTVLRNLMKKNSSTIKAYSYDNSEDAKELKDIVASDEFLSQPDTKFRSTVITKSLAVAVCTRNRNWDNDEYQKGVVEPYRKIQELQRKLEEEKKEPTADEMRQALDMLVTVFNTKKTPVNEQMERFNEIFEATGTGDLFVDFIQGIKS